MSHALQGGQNAKAEAGTTQPLPPVHQSRRLPVKPEQSDKLQLQRYHKLRCVLQGGQNAKPEAGTSQPLPPVNQHGPRPSGLRSSPPLSGKHLQPQLADAGRQASLAKSATGELSCKLWKHQVGVGLSYRSNSFAVLSANPDPSALQWTTNNTILMQLIKGSIADLEGSCWCRTGAPV